MENRPVDEEIILKELESFHEMDLKYTDGKRMKLERNKNNE